MPGIRLEGCKRGNGDGLTTTPHVNPDRQKLCECKVCQASRWLRMKVSRGQLAPSQESVVRELIRALGGDS